MSLKRFTFIDLFAGIGGFRLALDNLGGDCLFSSEWDKNAQTTYNYNFDDKPYGDITLEETQQHIPNHDILCAGFPCQAFSIAGLRQGFKDSRGTLFFEIEQIIKKHRPKVVFLENVKNLLNHDNGNTFNTIYNILHEKLGYEVKPKVLNTMQYANIPQNRERIFIIAFDPEQVPLFDDFTFPEELPLTTSIHDIIDQTKQEDIFYYPSSHNYYEMLDTAITSRDTIYQWRRVYVRENKNNVCPTLTANMGTGGHNVPIIRDDFGIRKLTPRECFAFQGFPDSYKLPKLANSHLYKQAGNAVTTSLVQRVGEEILKVM